MIDKESSTNSAIGALDLLESRVLRTLYGECHERLYRFQNHDISTLAFLENDVDDVPVRIHSTCFSAHYMSSAECDCREQLDMTLRAMAKEGRGVVVFLEQDGRGNGHAALMRSSVLSAREGITVGAAYAQLGYPEDARNYVGAGLVLVDMGVRSVRLMTNNPVKIASLESAGVDVTVVETVVAAEDGPWLMEYYRSKAAEGHHISVASEA